MGERCEYALKDVNCAVVLIEQMNRDAVNRKSPRPVVTALHATAALEHAADAIVLRQRLEKQMDRKTKKARL